MPSGADRLGGADSGADDAVIVPVARPAPGRPLDGEYLDVPVSLAARIGVVGERDAVELSVPSTERRVFCRARVSTEAGCGTDLVRLGHALWGALGVRPGQPVRVAAADLPPARRVTLSYAAKHLHADMQQKLTAALLDSAPVIWQGKEQFLLPAGPGVRYRVRVHAVEPAVCQVAADTDVHVVAEPKGSVENPTAGIATGDADVGGLDAVHGPALDLLRRSLLEPELFRSLGIRPIKGVLLHGPHGTGKTLLARVLGAEIGATMFPTSATELVGTYAGETEGNLRTLFATAVKAAPALVIIDEIDALTADRRRSSSLSDVRVTTQLLSLMDGLVPTDGVAMIGTTNRLDAIDEAYRRPGRFDAEYYVGPPRSGEDRMQILDIHTRAMPLTGDALRQLATLAYTDFAGSTGADLMHVARRIGLNALERIAGQEEAHPADRVVAVEARDVIAATSTYRSSLLRNVEQAGAADVVAWRDIVGLDAAKSMLRAVADDVLDAGAVIRDGILLTGAPGSGKTALARSLAGELGATLVEVDVSAIFNQWLGESESHLRTVFERARETRPSVLVLDHVEVIGGARDDAAISSSADRRVLGTLLAELDRALALGDVVVIATSDKGHLIDGALTRAGRLGRHVDLGATDGIRARPVAEWAATSLMPAADDGQRARLVDDILANVHDHQDVAEVIRQAAAHVNRLVDDKAGRELSSDAG